MPQENPTIKFESVKGRILKEVNKRSLNVYYQYQHRFVSTNLSGSNVDLQPNHRICLSTKLCKVLNHAVTTKDHSHHR